MASKTAGNGWKERTDIQQKRAISKEVDRLSALFEGLEGKKKDVVEGLIQECAFMRIQLEEMKVKLLREGFVVEMPQGKYVIRVESPVSRAYSTMLQRYTTAIGKLTELLPKEVQGAVDDGFDDFVDDR